MSHNFYMTPEIVALENAVLTYLKVIAPVAVDTIAPFVGKKFRKATGEKTKAVCDAIDRIKEQFDHLDQPGIDRLTVSCSMSSVWLELRVSGDDGTSTHCDWRKDSPTWYYATRSICLGELDGQDLKNTRDSSQVGHDLAEKKVYDFDKARLAYAKVETLKAEIDELRREYATIASDRPTFMPAIAEG